LCIDLIHVYKYNQPSHHQFISYAYILRLCCVLTYYPFLLRCMQCRLGLAMRILSVRPSVKRMSCDKMEEWLVGGDPFYLKFWVNRPPLERNRRFSTDNRP